MVNRHWWDVSHADSFWCGTDECTKILLVADIKTSKKVGTANPSVGGGKGHIYLEFVIEITFI